MKISDIKSNIKIIWMNFDEYKEQIYALRKEVFVEGQELSAEVVTSPYDSTGLHLGAFHNGKLVSSISAYIYSPQDPIITDYALPKFQKEVVQLSRRAELSHYRGAHLAEFIGAIAWKAIFETIHPDYFVIGLYEIHHKLRLYYNTFGFNFYKLVDTAHGKMSLFINHDKELLTTTYIKVKKYVQSLSEKYEIEPPSLLHFLEKTGDWDHLTISDLKKENLYLNSLSFEDELPRLIAQARLSYLTQEPILERLSLSKTSGVFLDIGSGAGVYLAAIAQNKHFQGYRFLGMDISEDMIRHAKLSYSNIEWKQGSVYDTGLADNSVEVVHTGFLFIHLSNPELALMEIYRILKPSGILYVLDVNDSTFEGHSIIKSMIQKHKDIYEGNRDILLDLPQLAKNQHFNLKDQHSITVENTAQEDEVQVLGTTIKLGRTFMWAMYAFIAQRKEMAEYYQKAEEYYFKHSCKISVQVQTQIYEKQP